MLDLKDITKKKKETHYLKAYIAKRVLFLKVTPLERIIPHMFISIISLLQIILLMKWENFNP